MRHSQFVGCVCARGKHQMLVFRTWFNIVIMFALLSKTFKLFNRHYLCSEAILVLTLDIRCQ
jgi:hypothetical protein